MIAEIVHGVKTNRVQVRERLQRARHGRIFKSRGKDGERVLAIRRLVMFDRALFDATNVCAMELGINRSELVRRALRKFILELSRP